MAIELAASINYLGVTRWRDLRADDIDAGGGELETEEQMHDVITHSRIVMNRTRAIPSADTLTIKPIRELVKRYLHKADVSIDPFARNCTWATYTNDLNPDTAAEYHLEAQDFLQLLESQGVEGDVGIFDPPYSPRQVQEVYAGIGRTVTQADTQMVDIRRESRNRLARLIKVGGYIVSFGWNSAGMGVNRNYELREILLVCHGGWHNDTICTVEQKVSNNQGGLFEVLGGTAPGYDAMPDSRPRSYLVK